MKLLNKLVIGLFIYNPTDMIDDNIPKVILQI